MKAFWPDKLSYLKNRELLGAGQYGLVYRVFNPHRNHQTVVKIIEVVQDIEKQVIKRFKREIRALQKIESPHLVKLFDYWMTPDFIAFEMEYIRGISLEQFMKNTAHLPYLKKQDVTQNIIQQSCRGLQAIHWSDLVHRDLKPANILLKIDNAHENLNGEELADFLRTHEFMVKITDFGVVKDLSETVSITRSSDFLGTAAYISPEQGTGKKITPASDMYSLGVIWYEMVSGKNPFQKKNIYQTIKSHIHEQAPNIHLQVPQIPLDFSHVLMILLQKSPDQRFYTPERICHFLAQRDKRPESPDYDVSLLLNTPPETKNQCEGFNKIETEFLNLSSDSNLISCLYPDLTTKHHFLHHVEQQGLIDREQTFFYSVNSHPNFMYSFPSAIFRQISENKRHDFRLQLPDDSLLREMAEFFEFNDFNKEFDYIQFKLLKIPPPIKIYNWLQLLFELFAFLGKDQPVSVVFDGLDKIWPSYSQVLIPLWARLGKAQLNWLLLLENTAYRKLKDTISDGIHIREIHLRSFFQKKPCRMSHQVMTRSTTKSPARTGELELTSFDSPDSPEKISSRDRDYLEYLALSGFTNPIEFINWLLNERFERRGDIILSLFQKKVLQKQPHIYRPKQIVFYNRKLFKNILSRLNESEQKRKLETVMTFWETRHDVTGKEHLITLLWELKAYSRLAHLIKDLLNFYFGMADFVAHGALSQQVGQLTKSYKIPTPLSIQFRIHQYLSRTYTGTSENVLREAENIYHRLSGKYRQEKKTLAFIIVVNALITEDFETADSFIKIIGESESQYTSKLASGFFHSILLFKTDHLQAAFDEMSETLMNLKQHGYYWDIPTGSYLIGRILTIRKEWEPAYRYAAMAFQAARVLKDFWTMQRSYDLIKQNPYYLENRDQLMDWDELTRDQLGEFPVSLFEEVDIRDSLLKFKH